MSNGGELGAECIMKKIGKVCKSQQRMQEETVSRNVAAVSRNPDQLWLQCRHPLLQRCFALGVGAARQGRRRTRRLRLGERRLVGGGCEGAGSGGGGGEVGVSRQVRH